MTVSPQPTREQLNLPDVLEALSNPLRLRVVVELAAGCELSCGELLSDIPKSTATHHWRILRESGVVGLRRDGRYIRGCLRREDLDARFPGLIDAVLAAAPESVRTLAVQR